MDDLVVPTALSEIGDTPVDSLINHFMEIVLAPPLEAPTARPDPAAAVTKAPTTP